MKTLTFCLLCVLSLMVPFSMEAVYRKNLKNQESDKASSQPRLLYLLCSSKVHRTFKESSQPQNLHLERATLAQRQGASENANFKATSTTSETDSSGSFGMSPLLMKGDARMEPYTTTEKAEMIVIGIACRTSNLPEAGPKDIPRLWERFYTEGVFDKIPNKTSDDVIALYCDYEGDFTQPYTCVIGCAAASMDQIPEGMVAKRLPASKYARFAVAGEFPNSLINAWGLIWKTDLQRTYTGDFEMYSKDFAADPLKRMDIYIAVEE